jgi:hypothetical protein
MEYTIISDPNHCMGGAQDFRVHKQGCADIARHKRHPKFGMAGNAWTVQADSAEEAVAKEVAVFEKQEMSYAACDFKICLCCRR